MFFNFHLQERYVTRAKKLQKELRGDNDTNQMECKKCSFCCWMRPCNLAKDDIEIMSKHFNITPFELFKKYLVVDTVLVSGDNSYSLTPIRKEWDCYAGSFLPSSATFDINTPCVFLNEKTKECKLHEKAKPHGGRQHKCWDKQNEADQSLYSFKREELEELVGWDGDVDGYY